MPLKIRDIMNKNVITVDTDYTVKHAAKIMSRFGIGCLVALENNVVAGLLTERDLLDRIVTVARNPEETFVREIMSRPVIVADPKMALEDAIKLMVEHKIKKLPVVKKRPPGKGKLVGLVTLTDIARHQQELIKMRARAQTEYNEKYLAEYYWHGVFQFH